MENLLYQYSFDSVTCSKVNFFNPSSSSICKLDLFLCVLMDFSIHIYTIRFMGSVIFVLPAKHGLHIGIMLASSALSHFWFPIDNFWRVASISLKLYRSVKRH